MELQVKYIFAKNIKDLREDSDLSQTDVAKLLKISQRAYSHYERGDREMSLDSLVQIADYFNVSIDYLLGRTNKKEVNR